MTQLAEVIREQKRRAHRPDLRIETETFTAALAAEMLPLAQACWDESTFIKKETCAYYGERDFAIEPDLERYGRLAASGVMLLMTLRNSTLNGYIMSFTYRSPHHKKILCGSVDSAYIAPEYRSYAAVLVEKFEQAMSDRGVNIIGWSTHINGPLYHVLKSRGYVGDDVMMEKLLVRR
jgi:hypothetical protein